MTVELICVGTELLLGNITNTNARYLSEQCALLGLSVYYQTVVGDNEERLSETVKTGLSRSDIVILSGGLGPTEDDLTKEVCAKAMGFSLTEDKKAKEKLIAYFQGSSKEIPENNWKQAMVPEGSQVLYNDNGTAPGIIMEKDGKAAILLPGPPGELIPMFEKQVKPYLSSRCPEILYSRMVKICGIGESQVETMIKDLIDSQTTPTIAPYAKTGEVHLRITAKAQDEKQAKQLIKPVIKELKKRFGYHIFTTDPEESLEDVVVGLLRKYGLTIATAESCTGGLLTGRIVNVPGASDCLHQGFVTYSNKAKRKYLGVKKETLNRYGAVSAQTVEEMARGGAINTKSDICVSVSGIAGPGGGTEEKPVGLVYIGCFMNGQTVTEKYQFHGERGKIRDSAVTRALDLVRRTICEQEKEKKKKHG